MLGPTAVATVVTPLAESPYRTRLEYREVTLSAAPRLWDTRPSHRLRLVASLQQVSLDLRPARRKSRRGVADGHPVPPRRALVAHHRSHCRRYVSRRTDYLHQVLRHCRTFAFVRRRDRLHQLAPFRVGGSPRSAEEAPRSGGFSVFQWS